MISLHIKTEAALSKTICDHFTWIPSPLRTGSPSYTSLLFCVAVLLRGCQELFVVLINAILCFLFMLKLSTKQNCHCNTMTEDRYFFKVFPSLFFF